MTLALTACLSFFDNQRWHEIWRRRPPHNSLCRKNPGSKHRVGYRNPVPIWHRYLCNRYVLEPNQTHFGAIPERSIKIFVLCFSETHVRSITGYNYKYFSKMYILVRVIALLFHCTPSVWRARARRRSFCLNQQNRTL